MDMMPTQNVRILVVDFYFSASVANLLKSKYEVLAVGTGQSALHILLQKHHGFSLVVTDIKLPDMGCLDFLKKVEKATRLPVVMMCDTFDQHLVMHGLMNGAMMCLMKPLSHKDIKKFWQFPIVKKREVMRAPRQPLMSDIPEDSITPREAVRPSVLGFRQFRHASIFPKKNLMTPESSSGSQRYGKRKIDEMEKGSCWSMGQTLPFSWTPDLRLGFPNIAQGSSISNACPSEVAHYVSVPGVGINLAANSVQQFRMCFRPQHIFQSQMVSPVATFAISPNMPFMMGQVPNNNTGQAPNNYHETMHREERESALTRFTRDPHCRQELKVIVRGSISRWEAQYLARASTPLASLASIIDSQGAAVLPTSVPIGLAIEMERIIFANLNAAYAQPEFMVPLPERIVGNGALGPGFPDVLDAGALFDAIIELLNELQT
ncbi:hypothetical protein KSS87_000773 [Heliosperma pusillum]|nr:hypothetical protein KSS87_000773 [Heliosperma pusillum]